MNLHEKFIKKTFSLARKGVNAVSPNPMVGCVIVKNGKMIGQGFHQKFGAAHAEINALRSAGKKARGATLYCNLEPCSHFGKTPPCAEAIAAAGIQKVVCSMKDPNPLVSGKGFEKLKRAGVAVESGLLETQARQLNAAFIKFMTQKKPYVILKSAISLDGKIASSGGESQWITDKPARTFSHILRTQVDAIVVGAETVRRDNPSLRSHGKGRDPLRIVLTASGKIPKHSKIFPAWVYQTKKLDADKFLKECGRRGISKVLVEGGGESAAAFLEQRAVDEVYYFIAPMLLGGRNAKTAFEGRGFKKISEALRLEILHTQRLGNDLMVHAKIIVQNNSARKRNI